MEIQRFVGIGIISMGSLDISCSGIILIGDMVHKSEMRNLDMQNMEQTESVPRRFEISWKYSI
jgi:hypothetical protein